MKIKRFEASSMSDALRMVKKEFGEEAVILSAKNVGKSSRIFGKRAGGKVIVTAAIDEATPPDASMPGASAPQWQLPDLSDVLQGSAQKSSEAGGSVLERFTPITRTGKQKLGPKLVRLLTENRQAPETPNENSEMTLYPTLLSQGLEASLASELAAIADEVLPPASTEHDRIEALSQAIQTRAWSVPPGSRRPKEPRTIVLVGPSGCGKTTTAAKLAASAILSSDQTVGLISLDNQRVGGQEALSRLAAVMGIELAVAADAAQVSAAMAGLDHAQLIVVDTPGLAPDDVEGREALQEMIAAMDDPEVHLLLNAGGQERVLIKAIRFFRPLGVNRVLPTHLDWCDRIGPLLNQISLGRLPMAYFGNGIRVPEDLQAATPRDLAVRLLGLESTPASAQQEEGVTVVQRRRPTEEAGQRYVANRNSDIFHQTDCKSVQRISEANALMFKDSNEALAQGFKPCRMCCSEHIVLKPIDRLARTRYAGSRN